MRIFSFSASVLGLILALGVSTSAVYADQMPATITVVGHSSVTRPPDIAIITAEIVANDPDAARAAAANDVLQDRVANELAKLHLSDKATHTISYRSNYLAPSQSTDSHERSGYVVTRTIEVEVRPARIDEVTHALTTAGIDTIDDIRTDIRDRDGVYHTLFIQALNEAESQAHIIATAARVKIVRLRSVDASTLTPSIPGMAFSEARMASIPLQNTTISTGLTAVYEVEPFPLPGYMRRIPNPARPNGAQ